MVLALKILDNFAYHILVNPEDFLDCRPIWVSIPIITDRCVNLKVLITLEFSKMSLTNKLATNTLIFYPDDVIVVKSPNPMDSLSSGGYLGFIWGCVLTDVNLNLPLDQHVHPVQVVGSSSLFERILQKQTVQYNIRYSQTY